ncbi:MAG: TonB-dependent receptor [Spirochaetia bacterium]|nr:TonB-dependent receptor [Spirochaetia bacterium]
MHRYFFYFFIILPSFLWAQASDFSDMSLEDLMNIKVVSSTKKAERIIETPASVRVNTAKEIKERGYLTFEDLLSDLPGIQFRNIQGFNSYTFFRGGGVSQNNKVLILVNGMKINELNSGGFYGGGQYNLSNIKRVEILYNPASPMYGTNALSGIVNIITYEPSDYKETHSAHVGILYGNFNTQATDFRHGYYDKEIDFGVSLSGMYKHTEKLRLSGANNDNIWTDDVENFETNVSTDAIVTLGGFSLGFLYQDKNASRTTKYLPSQSQEFGTNWHIRFMNAYLSHVIEKENWSNTAKFYFTDTTVLNDTVGQISLSGNYQKRYYRPNYLIGLEETFSITALKNLKLIGSLNYEFEKLADGFSTTTSASFEEAAAKPDNPDSYFRNNLFSAYLQLQYALLDSLKTGKLELTLGGRVDYSSSYNFVFTPRTGLVYHRKGLFIKALYMEGYRAPKPWDYDGPSGGIANPELKPEEVKSGEFIAGYNFTNWLKTDVSVYRNYYFNLIQVQNLQNINIGHVKVTGIEPGLTIRFSNLSLFGYYTYTAAKDNNQESLKEIAKHTGGFGMRFIPVASLIWEARTRYSGNRHTNETIPGSQNTSIAPYTVVDTSLSYMNFYGLDFQLMVKNLFNEKYFHPTNYSLPRIRQPQRTLLVRMIYNL